LKDLLKVDASDIRKSLGRVRDAMETLTMAVARILRAQDVCGHGLLEERCNTEQLHQDVKQQPRESKELRMGWMALHGPDC